jgi:hypothetical protein
MKSGDQPDQQPSDKKSLVLIAGSLLLVLVFALFGFLITCRLKSHKQYSSPVREEDDLIKDIGNKSSAVSIEPEETSTGYKTRKCD